MLQQRELTDALSQQLQSVAQRLRAGMDIAPAQRLWLEGIAVALIAGGADIDRLAQTCAEAGAGIISVVRDGDRLRFDCWQQRAPVFPSTPD